MWELLIVNHLDQSLCMANQKQGAAVKSFLVHFFSSRKKDMAER